MRIGFASSDWATRADWPPQPGGSGWYRCALPAKGLARLGHETFHGVAALNAGEFCVQTWDGALHDSLDVVVLQRYMGDDVERTIRKSQAGGQVIVNDLDDWFFGMHTSNQAWWRAHPRNEPQVNLNHYARSIAASDLLTVSTPYLLERCRSFFPGTPIGLVRNAIDPEQWQRRPIQPRKRQLVVGWVGGTSWRADDLSTLKGVLGPWLDAHDARFYHGGHAPSPAVSAGEQLGIGDEYERDWMCQIAEYPRLFERIDIGIVPLNDVPFNHAKSALKGMEYAAAGIPFIASRTPEYDWFDVGLRARRAHEWTRALTQLLDPEARVHTSDDAFARVQKETIEQRAREWAAAFNRLLGKDQAWATPNPQTPIRSSS